MEWNLNTRSEWEWEVEMPESLVNGGCGFLGFEDRGGMVEEGSVLSGEAMIGLNLGRQTYDSRDKVRPAMGSFPFVSNSSSCSPIMKRSRALNQSSHSPRCQVEGCNLDLASAKDYHRRHRICSDHSKSATVVVDGMERRFCQQCSRLHDLSEFDDRKRSCRRRLYAHNARRRRPQSEDIQFSSTHRKPRVGFLANHTSIRSQNSSPRSSSMFKDGSVDMMSNGTLSNSSTSFHGVMPRNVNHENILRNVSGGMFYAYYKLYFVVVKIKKDFVNTIMVFFLLIFIGFEVNSNSRDMMDVRHAFSSMMVTNSWNFNGLEEHSSSFDHFVHGDNIGLTQVGMPPNLQSTHNSQVPPHDFDCFCSN
ncbi:hypothetical protein OSB04_031236 [Centaurea solstitialis]|uniref:SBP-type domain-containing protein n=1 Tax=Centaurea solstitialis TaxID=347529 RepID=A0AA38SGN3_9ASTR|nr:hypothetical protein OSB04_031236 [Centaurea solstitialis]